VIVMALLLACGSSPFDNDPPKLKSVNGVEVGIFGQIQPEDPMVFFAEPGTDYAIELEIEDPERKPVRVWWPYQPEGWDFDPDASSGVWHVPGDGVPRNQGMQVILEDTDRQDPQIKSYYLPIFTLSGDTGFPDSGGF
jgi:hypothetical protein